MISVSIIHAPWVSERAANVQELLKQVPRAVVVADNHNRRGSHLVGNRRGCWPMAARAWKSRDPLATHHVVLEDDAQLCDNFLELANQAIKQQPESALSLFMGSRRLCSVATSLPTKIIDKWLLWAAEDSKTYPHHDALVIRGMEHLGVQLLYARPSLVNHRAFQSLLAHQPHLAVQYEQSPSSVSLEEFPCR
jgi:hypothetical protein